MMMARDGNFAYRQDLNSECTSNCSNSLDLEWENEYVETEEWYFCCFFSYKSF